MWIYFIGKHTHKDDKEMWRESENVRKGGGKDQREKEERQEGKGGGREE